jgi:glycosyltransferase involved in cell wall biosynthesis
MRAMHVVLLLMVRNESAILARCLSAALPVCDAVCIADTGSTDGTVDLARGFHTGGKPVHVVQHEWRNFGHNRTLSIDAARDWVMDVLDWPVDQTWVLALDADMVLCANVPALRQLLSVVAVAPNMNSFMIEQRNTTQRYMNTRLMRLAVTWNCIGVTHEYWMTPDTQSVKGTVPPPIAHIWDASDGGCKADKIPRDLALLEASLKEDPDNERNLFYYASTLQNDRQFKEAIAVFKRRLNTGWDEERWYSRYMIAKCYLSLGDLIRAEAWAQRAWQARPTRTEPLLWFASVLREKGVQHAKAWSYVADAAKVTSTNDLLFVEQNAYPSPPSTQAEAVLFERVVLSYYVFGPGSRQGMDNIAAYDEKWARASTVKYNVKWYTDRLPGVVWRRVHGEIEEPDADAKPEVMSPLPAWYMTDARVVGTVRGRALVEFLGDKCTLHAWADTPVAPFYFQERDAGETVVSIVDDRITYRTTAGVTWCGRFSTPATT